VPRLNLTVASQGELAALLAWPAAEGPINRIQIERSDTGGGAGYANIGSVTLVTDTLSYTYYDVAGDNGDWYRWYYSNAGNTFPLSANRVYTPEFQPGGLHPDNVDIDEVRAYVRITDPTDNVDDSVLSLAISAASRLIDNATDRQYGLGGDAFARYYTPCYSPTLGRYEAEIDDLMSSTGLVVKTDLEYDGVYETTITDYVLHPRNAPSDYKPWTKLVFGQGVTTSYREGSLEVTAVWGWTAVPEAIKTATLIQASRFYKRRDAPFGVAGSPAMGNELRLLAKLDPDVEMLLLPFRSWLVR
jgi:hypothetical protein